MTEQDKLDARNALDMGNALAIMAYKGVGNDPSLTLTALIHAVGNIYGALKKAKLIEDQRGLHHSLVNAFEERLSLEDAK